jgi:peptidyl-prolyl cis-trans isomerase C
MPPIEGAFRSARQFDTPLGALDIMKIMQFFRILSLYAAALCLVAQTPNQTPPKPPLPATPVAPSTPATPTVAGPEGITLPLEIVAAPVLPPDRVVIQVGDIKITAGQMDQILQAYPENQRVFVNGPGRSQFLDQLVRVLLLSEEGRRRKLTETDAYRNQLMYSAAGILARHTEDEIRGKVQGDEALLKAYYEAHRSEYEQIHVYHILVRMQGSAVSLAPGQKDLTETEALAKASEMRQKIVQGADFADLARTQSDDMGSSAKGGDLGFLKRGQTVPSFEEAAFALPAGELSQPVKTTYGYHLIKVEERKPTRTFEELRPEMERNLGNEATRKLVEDLKAKTKIVIDPEFSATPNVTLGLKQ